MSYSIINIYRMYHYLFIQLQTFANCSLEIVPSNEYAIVKRVESVLYFNLLNTIIIIYF
jgi:hypothetical protein